MLNTIDEMKAEAWRMLNLFFYHQILEWNILEYNDSVYEERKQHFFLYRNYISFPWVRDLILPYPKRRNQNKTKSVPPHWKYSTWKRKRKIIRQANYWHKEKMKFFFYKYKVIWHIHLHCLRKLDNMLFALVTLMHMQEVGRKQLKPKVLVNVYFFIRMAVKRV